MATSGSIESLSVGARTFAVAADADANMILGGKENEMLPNGDGSTRQKKMRKNWSLTGVSVAIDHSKGDQEFLQERADSEILVACSITYADGSVYSGQGNVTGELASASADGVLPLELAGPKKLTKQ